MTWIQSLLKKITFSKIGLTIVGATELILNWVFVVAITANWFEVIGFAVLYALAVVLKIQGWIKGKRIFWALGAFITYLSFVSFSASVISNGLGAIKLAEPEYVVNARSSVDTAKTALSGLIEKQKSGQYSQSTDDMDRQIDNANTRLTQANDNLNLMLDKMQHQRNSGIEVFSRIPLLIKTANEIFKEDTVHSIGIFIAVIFILAFGIFAEYCMIFAAGERPKKRGRKPKK